MASSLSDLNLLFGILALQMDFINREQLVGAMQAWLCDKNKKLGNILVEQNVLTPPRFILLQALVDEHLKQHHNDPQQSLAAACADDSVKGVLKNLGDADVDATLASVGAVKDVDPYATCGASASAPTPPGMRFRILRLHARGGLGAVYVAHDEELHREVALKEIQDQHAHNEGSRARFLLEAEITGRLEHPGIVPVYGLGAYADGRPYYAMRFIKGDSLQDAIERFHKADPARDQGERSLDLRGLLARFINVCNAIQYAHDRGVLHRDLKPSNIMLGRYGETLVVDWGLAKSVDVKDPSTEESSLKPQSMNDTMETMQGSAVGTPSFMSPEQAWGRIDQLGPTSDVYSLGATLYCLLTGKAPIDTSAVSAKDRPDLATILKKVQRGDFPRPRQVNPRVDRALEAICLRAMALQPQDRYRNPRALANDLEHWLADRPVSAWPEPWSVRWRRWVGRHRTFVASAAMTLLAGVVSLIILNVILKSANDDLLRSEENEREAKNAATEKEQDALKAKGEADAARLRAVQAQEESAEMLAQNTLMLAQTRWNEGQAELANDLLDDVPPLYRARSGGWGFLSRKYEGGYCTLYGHLKPVNGVAFSPDGRFLATVSFDKTMKLWDAATGAPLWTAEGHHSGTSGLAFSPDGTLLASSSWDRTVKIWDVRQRKELLTFARHSKPVSSVAFSPDGKSIASAGEDMTIKVWDPRSGKEFFTLIGHTDAVRSIVFSPDGKSIASSGDDWTVKIWDADRKGPARHSFEGHTDNICCVAFSPDGRRLASASDDDTIKLWSIDQKKEIYEIKKHGNDVRSVAFSPNGRVLASASYDKTVKLWDAANGNLVQTFLGHTSAVVGVAFSPDGQRLASASADKTVKLWDARVEADGRVDAELLTVRGHEKGVTSASLSHDGRRLATAGKDKMVLMWDTYTGRLLFSCKGHTDDVQSVALSRDGKHLASAGRDKGIKLWNVADGKELRTLTGHDGVVWSVAFSPDSNLLASASEDHSIKLWDVVSGKELMKLEDHTAGVRCVAFSPGGHRLASASSDMTIKIWNTRSGKVIRTLRGHNYPVSSVAFSPVDGDERLVSGSWDKTIIVWDHNKGQELLTIPAAHSKQIQSVSFSPNGKRLASAGAGGMLNLWDAATGLELMSIVAHDGKAVQSVSFSDDKQSVVTAGDDHTCKLWDVHIGKRFLILKDYKHGIRSVTFSKDNQSLAAAGWQGTVKMWNASTGKELLPLKFDTIKDKVVVVQFSPVDDILATAGQDRTVKLWNSRTGVEIRALKKHTGSISCVAFSLDGKRLASAGADNSIIIWDTHTGAPLATLTGHTDEVRSVDFSPDGKLLASGGYDKTVKLWDVETGSLLRNFSKNENWVTKVNFSADGKRIVSRNLSEMIHVWDFETDESRESKDPDPSPFPAHLVDNGTKLVLTTAKKIQFIDLMPASEELSYRQAMSRVKPWWHEEQARRFEKRARDDDGKLADWFAAGFHWSWGVSAAPTFAGWQGLDQACRHLKDWRHAQAACDRLVQHQVDVRIPPEFPWLNFLLAVSHHRLGDKLKAEEFFGRAKLMKDASPEQLATFERLRGAAELELKQP